MTFRAAIQGRQRPHSQPARASWLGSQTPPSAVQGFAGCVRRGECVDHAVWVDDSIVKSAPVASSPPPCLHLGPPFAAPAQILLSWQQPWPMAAWLATVRWSRYSRWAQRLQPYAAAVHASQIAGTAEALQPPCCACAMLSLNLSHDGGARRSTCLPRSSQPCSV
jgi:hypothetical protein